MRTSVLWQDSVRDAENNEQTIYCVCFEPGGNRLLAAVGSKVLVYNTDNGQLIEALKGHKDLVYCLAYAGDGQRFASGGADKVVVIWTPQLEGILKYSHTDSIQCLAYNPVTHQLLSCATADFGIWSWEQKAVTKHRVVSRITSCAWKQDGALFALGMTNGNVSIRNRAAEEILRIERPQEVWGVAFCPQMDDEYELAIADWSQTLTFYTLNGRMASKEKPLGFDCLCMKYFGSSYLLVTGSNNAITILSREGVHIGGPMCEQKSWIWSCDVIPNKDSHQIAIGCQDGTIAVVQLGLATVHSLYRERYAFRENMTHVVIQHMVSGEKVRIKCRDVVRKLAIYKDNLAVQLAERVIIYEQAESMHYKVKRKLNLKIECSLLVICSENLVLCQEKVLQSLTLEGTLDRQWIMSAPIRYIKVIGGCKGREGLLIGAKDGSVTLVYLNSPVALEVLKKQGCGIRCLDASAYRNKIAVVDDMGVMKVYNRKDLKKVNTIFEEKEAAASVACSTQLEDLCAYSGNQSICVRLESEKSASNLTFEGFVVGLSGNNAFCLQYNTMITFRLALGVAIQSSLNEDTMKAYNICCIGANKSDWQKLFDLACNRFEYDIVSKIAVRRKNYALCAAMKAIMEESDEQLKKVLLLARVQKQYVEAMKLEGDGGNAKVQAAVDAISADLNIFDKGRTGKNKVALLRRAQWAMKMNDYKTAVEAYLSAGDVVSAITILAQNDQQDQVWQVLKSLDPVKNLEELVRCAQFLKSINQLEVCVKIFEQLNDKELLLQVYCDAALWDKAIDLANKFGTEEMKKDVYYSQANWLAENDKFIEAQIAFQKAGRPADALRVLEQLLENALEEERYTDVAWYYFKMSTHFAEQAQFTEYERFMKLSEIYYAYNFIHRYIVDPFTLLSSHTLFFISRFLVNEEEGLSKAKAISQSSILIALTKQCSLIGAFKVARTAYNKLSNLITPRHADLQHSVAVNSIISRSKAFADSEDADIPCYACSSMHSALLKSNTCPACLNKMIISMISFEVLPVVKLKGISLDPDVFEEQLNAGRLFVDEEYSLSSHGKQLNPRAVIIVRKSAPLKTEYFLNIMPDVQITYCKGCYKLFASDDFEMSILQHSHCPFCRSPQDVDLELNPNLGNE